MMCRSTHRCSSSHTTHFACSVRPCPTGSRSRANRPPTRTGPCPGDCKVRFGLSYMFWLHDETRECQYHARESRYFTQTRKHASNMGVKRYKRGLIMYSITPESPVVAYTHTHTRTHTHTHTHMCTHAHTDTHTHTHTDTHARTHKHTYTHTTPHTHIHTRTPHTLSLIHISEPTRRA